jgi:hypothetical protein
MAGLVPVMTRVIWFDLSPSRTTPTPASPRKGDKRGAF